MPDNVDTAVRSRMMSGIRSKNTKPEIAVRKAMHSRGFRYRLHRNDLPGRPDIVLPRFRAVIFVNGCFWHGHQCSLFRLPGTRPEFWADKIDRNRKRDAEVQAKLKAVHWRQLTIWECAFRGPSQIGLNETVDRTISWLTSQLPCAEISSHTAGETQ